MALTPDQDAYFRDRLGSGYDDADAEERLVAAGGSGYEPVVVVGVLRQRLSNLMVAPLSFTVVGEYSEDRSKNVALVQEQLTVAMNEAAALDVGEPTVSIQQSYLFDYPVRALDTEEFVAGRRLRGGR